MSQKNDKKKFKETKFGQFVNKAYAKVKDKAPELANSIITVATSPNPVGAVISEVGDLVRKTDDNSLIAEFTMNAQEYELELYKLDNEDRANARAMYPESKDVADNIASSIFRFNLWFVIGLVGVLVFCAKYLDSTILAIISAVIGAIIRDLMAERQQVNTFLFGSSKGSKAKDKQIGDSINELSKKVKY